MASRDKKFIEERHAMIMKLVKEDGRVTAASISEYLHNHPGLKRWRDRQEPSVVFDGDLVFSDQPARRTRVLIRAPAEASPIVEGGPGQKPWPVERGKHPGEFVVDLPRGLYEASARKLEPRYFKVSGTPGEVVNVSLG